MKDRSELGRLRWFLDFLNTDLENLAMGDRLKWIAETLTVLEYGRHDIANRPLPNNIVPPQRWNDAPPLEDRIQEWTKGRQLNECQDYLGEFFKGMMESIKGVLDRKGEWKEAKRLENYFCFAQIENPIKARLETPLIEPEFKTENEGKRISYRIKRELLKETTIVFSTKASSDKDTLLFHFCRALEGTPMGALRQCPECGRYFLHVSKREKEYCSNRCAARKGTRDNRRRMKEDDPEAYKEELKKGTKRARKSYVQRTQKKASGQNVKIDRRPRKYKD